MLTLKNYPIPESLRRAACACLEHAFLADPHDVVAQPHVISAAIGIVCATSLHEDEQPTTEA